MKKLLSLTLALVLSLAVCGAASCATRHKITSKTFPIYNDNTRRAEMPLYFLDGVTDLPYIEANDWLEMLTQLYDNKVKFTMSAEGSVVTYSRYINLYSENIPVTLDFKKDIICFQDYNLFSMSADQSAILDLTSVSGFDEEGKATLIQKVNKGTLARYGDDLKIQLGDYGIDLIAQDGLYLIPLQTVSDIFIAPVFLTSLYFNGQCMILSDDISDSKELYYAAPTGERSKELTKFGYGELCMMLDNVYGLKETHEIKSFGQLFHEVGFENVLQGPRVVDADKTIYRLITDYLDDNHSKWHAFSYLAGPNDYSFTGVSRVRVGSHLERQSDARAKFYPDGVPGYEEVGNTAFITFDEFAIQYEPDDYYRIENPLDFPDTDTIGLIIKAHAQINRENSPIENVVIDLSANRGGVADTAIFTIAWYLGEASVGMKDTMTGAMCSSTYRADVNRDRVFDERDTVSDKNLFCLIAPGSFSCGNLVPCIFKESGKVTLLGRTSGGGSCIVQPISSAWGSSFQISGSRRISFMKNGSFYDVDRGADPDFVITRPEKYYDRAALVDYINSLY